MDQYARKLCFLWCHLFEHLPYYALSPGSPLPSSIVDNLTFLYLQLTILMLLYLHLLLSKFTRRLHVHPPINVTSADAIPLKPPSNDNLVSPMPPFEHCYPTCSGRVLIWLIYFGINDIFLPFLHSYHESMSGFLSGKRLWLTSLQPFNTLVHGILSFAHWEKP